VFAHGQAVVGGEDDVGVGGFSGALEGVEDAADLLVHVGDDRVVLAAVELYGFLGAREWGEALVATGEHGGFEFEGMLGEEVGRDLDLVGRVEVEELLWRLAGIVGRVEAHVDEEWVVAFGGFGFEVIDYVVGVDDAGVRDGLRLFDVN